MNKCQICGKKDVSLLLAHHKDFGSIWICAECWQSSFAKNKLILSSGLRCCGR